MTWEELKSQDWGNQTGLVRPGQSYEGLFDKFTWTGIKSAGNNSFKSQTLVTFITSTGRQNSKLIKPLCSLVSFVPRGGRTSFKGNLGNWCERWWNGSASGEHITLSSFLKSDHSKKYFAKDHWSHYGEGWEALALLALLDLWSSRLTNVHFDKSLGIINQDYEGFKLGPLMNGSGAVLSLNSNGTENNLTSISYHSGDKWTLRLCSAGKTCNETDGLDVTVGNDQLCVSTVVCVTGSQVTSRYRELSRHWGGLQGSGQAGGLWGMVFGSKGSGKPLERLLISLVTSVFEDPKAATLSVLRPLSEGRPVFKQLEKKG